MKSAITATKKFKFRNRSRFLKEKMKSKFYDLAESSDVRCNHAAIIINRRSGEIISEGHNYHFHKKSSGPWKKKGSWSMHAEEAAYRKFLKIHKKCKHRPNDLFDLIVVRKYSNGEPGYMNSKPCEKCHAKLAKLKKKKIINKVYYSIESKTDELSNSIVEEHF